MKDRHDASMDAVDLDHPNSARVYDYFLGGSANWAIDRVFGDELTKLVPIIRIGARVNREFLGRAVRHAARNGITQFLDLGSGVPTVGNVHEVADTIDPESRCVYVDCEPVAVAHAKVLLERHGDPARQAVLHADLRDVDAVWKAALATRVLDPTQPIGLLMVSVLHFLDPQEEVPGVVAAYRDLLPPGSQLIISHATFDAVPDEQLRQFQAGVELYRQAGIAASPRDRETIRAYFGDFELAEPGLTWLPEWHVNDGRALLREQPAACCFVGGLGVKR